MKKLFIITIILMVIIFLAFSILVFFSDVFNIKEIKITGSTKYSDEEILKINGVAHENKAPIIYSRYFYEKIKDKKQGFLNNIYLNNPYIKDVDYQYILPGKIIINVLERIPIAIVKLDKSYVLTDSDAYALEIINNIDNYDGFIIIEGFVEHNYRLGRKIILSGDVNIESIYGILEILRLLDEEHKYDFMTDLYKIDVLPGSIIKLIFKNDFKVKLNINDDIYYKINFSGKIIYEGIEKPTKGTLDATLNNPTIVVE